MTALRSSWNASLLFEQLSVPKVSLLEDLRARLRAAVGPDLSVEVDPEEQVALVERLLAQARKMREAA